VQRGCVQAQQSSGRQVVVAYINGCQGACVVASKTDEERHSRIMRVKQAQEQARGQGCGQVNGNVRGADAPR
jgi:hypothetical protein